MSKTIAVVATGGTIACTTDEHGALVPTVSAAELVEATRAISAPDLGPGAQESLEFDTLPNDSVRFDSSSLTLTDLDDFLLGVHYVLAIWYISGSVITQGTYSIEDKAMALDLLLTSKKLVVMNG